MREEQLRQRAEREKQRQEAERIERERKAAEEGRKYLIIQLFNTYLQSCSQRGGRAQKEGSDASLVRLIRRIQTTSKTTHWSRRTRSQKENPRRTQETAQHRPLGRRQTAREGQRALQHASENRKRKVDNHYFYYYNY